MPVADTQNKKDITDTSTNPLVEEKVKVMPTDFYGADQKKYITHLQKRLETAYRVKSTIHPEWDNKTYYQVYEKNVKIANTNHLEAKKNEDDVVVSSGTIEQKLDALLSHVNNLNLSVEVDAYDKDKRNIKAIATGLEDIIHDTTCNEPGSDDSGDEEKRMARQRELLIQGTCFVQEEWLRLWEMKKSQDGKDTFDGKFIARDFASKLVKVFEGPSRTLLHAPNVFLGDITEFYNERQPFIFVVIQEDYYNAKARYGKLENFEYVQKGKIPPSTAGVQDNIPKTIFDNKWRLTDLKDNQVEVILYQDQPNDEFQILINGVLMLPIGYPLSWVTPRGKYNIAKQVFRIVNDKFAYGKGFVSSGSIQHISAIIDEMLKLFVLKTRKSIMPAYVNTSGRVIDRKVLSPGRISMGIDSGSLQPIAGNEVQGVTAGEANFLTSMRDLIDKSTVSDQFAGQPGKSGTTATEVMTLQQQAQLTMGLTIAACALLEKKLGYLRLFNILENWFQSTGTNVEVVGEARKMVKEYRKVTRSTTIEGAGPGERSVYPTAGPVPTPRAVRDMEIAQEKATGTPNRKIFINPEELDAAKLIFYVRCVPKEKESSAYFKLLFREMLNDLIALIKLGSQPNLEGIEEEFSRVWGKPHDKLFGSAQLGPQMAGVNGQMGPGGPNGPQTPDQVAQGRGQGSGNASGIPLAPGALAGMGGEGMAK